MTLLIIGAGGHGHVAAEVAEACGYEKIDFLDDNPGEGVIGSIEGLELWMGEYDQYFVGIGSNEFRRHLIGRLEKNGAKIATLIPEFRIRARMIQLGFVEAAGAMNYVDYKRIQPFAFDKDALSVEIHSYVISSHKLLVLCDTNSDLRELISSGKYIYADGHVVRNTLSYVKKVAEEYYLTDWANANVDLCCLRFTRQYVQNRLGHFVLGRLYYDAEYVQRTIEFLAPIMKKYKTDEISAKMKYKIEFMHGDLVDEFDRIMHMNGDTRESISEKLNISDKTLKRALDMPMDKMSMDMVVAMCLIWRLPDWLSMMLLQKTYNPLQEFDRRHQAIEHILRAMWDKGIDEANEYLCSLHLNELEFPKNN